VPRETNQPISWEDFADSGFATVFEKMQNTPQSPKYHGEGDVWVHTKMVCEALVGLEEYGELSKKEQDVVFLSAMLHDIGKTVCTILRDGEITSPYHTVKGAVLARGWLWQQFDLAGTKEKQALREAICMMVKYHSFPTFATVEKDWQRKMLKIAANGELTDRFSIKLLYLLSKADVLGRRSQVEDDYKERVECFKMMAEDVGCFEGPYSFTDAFSERAYFRRQTNWQDDSLWRDTWGEVIMLCGLPASGKDTYIATHLPEMEMISLDAIRERLGISPTDDQGKVIAAFQSMAKERLRKKQPFVYNATNLSKDIRQKQIDLFEKYGASVKIIFLETPWEEEMARNQSREAEVPQHAIDRMLGKLEMPERSESEAVVWDIT